MHAVTLPCDALKYIRQDDAHDGQAAQGQKWPSPPSPKDSLKPRGPACEATRLKLSSNHAKVELVKGQAERQYGESLRSG